MTSPLANLLGGGRRRLTLRARARGHLPLGYSHGMADRRGEKRRKTPSEKKPREVVAREKRVLWSRACDRQLSASHYALLRPPPPPPFTIFRLPWPRILIAVSQCTRSERGLMNERNRNRCTSRLASPRRDRFNWPINRLIARAGARTRARARSHSKLTPRFKFPGSVFFNRRSAGRCRFAKNFAWIM